MYINHITPFLHLARKTFYPAPPPFPVMHIDWDVYNGRIYHDADDRTVHKKVRYRTVGDMTCTAAVESEATTMDDVIHEIETSPISERCETRIDDQMSDAAMEDRKMKGYF